MDLPEGVPCVNVHWVYMLPLPPGMVQRSSILAESLTGHEMFTDEPRSAIPKEWIHVPKDASKDETKQTGTDKTASFLSLHSW